MSLPKVYKLALRRARRNGYFTRHLNHDYRDGVLTSKGLDVIFRHTWKQRYQVYLDTGRVVPMVETAVLWVWPEHPKYAEATMYFKIRAYAGKWSWKTDQMK